ncbi:MULTISPECIES: hypothetical protein [Actinomycetes]|uniref:Asp23/Gls24 family envelope stress response protein n=2 Tax=Actinomycetes TaxID=1760 RepID=A0ABP6M3C9_9MICC
MTSEDHLSAEQRLVAAVEQIPGAAQVVPGFRQILASATRSLLRPDTDERATGIDVVSRGGVREVYIDCHTDGTRPASEVADAVVRTAAAMLEVEPERVHVRIMHVNRTASASLDSGDPADLSP